MVTFVLPESSGHLKTDFDYFVSQTQYSSFLRDFIFFYFFLSHELTQARLETNKTTLEIPLYDHHKKNLKIFFFQKFCIKILFFIVVSKWIKRMKHHDNTGQLFAVALVKNRTGAWPLVTALEMSNEQLSLVKNRASKLSNLISFFLVLPSGQELTQARFFDLIPCQDDWT